ncbi:MAG: hypothetical protein IKQ60_02150 [Candidatus Methanomethylophilaceae archaeon]|nr:hypothetical protein [Candidatus Methanomethylophilaceae archaeon]
MALAASSRAEALSLLPRALSARASCSITSSSLNRHPDSIILRLDILRYTSASSGLPAASMHFPSASEEPLSSE